MAASYALPTTISPPAHDFERRSFFLQNKNPPKYPDDYIQKIGNSSEYNDNDIPVTTPNGQSISPRGKSFMRTKARPRGESDLGRHERPRPHGSSRHSTSRTSLNTVSESTKSPTLPIELLTSISIPMPFLLSTLISPSSPSLDHRSEPQDLEATSSTSPSSFMPHQGAAIFQACAMASMTLLLVGVNGRISTSPRVLLNQKNLTTHEKGISDAAPFSVKRLRRALFRALSVLLPFMASLELGGARTGIFLLASAATSPFTFVAHTSDSGTRKAWKQIRNHKWTLTVFFTCFFCDMAVFKTNAEPSSTFRGYLLLLKSMLFLPYRDSSGSSAGHQSRSPLTRSILESNCTLAAAVLLGVVACILSANLDVPRYTLSMFFPFLSSVACAAGVLIFARTCSLRSRHKPGLISGIVCCIIFHSCFDFTTIKHHTAVSILLLSVYVAVQLDSRQATATKPSSSRDIPSRQSHHHHHLPPVASPVTHFLLRCTEGFPLIHSILLYKESRRIVYFMSINLSFMFIQTFYALVAGSLGLLSDSIHMLFDCIGLLAGLMASIMSKWPPNAQFPYGYGKVETLSGLGNGIFLMIISVEIIWESFERFVEGAELRMLSELLVVSVGGLVVNCLGLIFIGHHHHGHSHSHTHSHAHAHEHGDSQHGNLNHQERYNDSHDSEHTHRLSNSSLKLEASATEHEKSKESTVTAPHCHERANENMAGIYLHILADTMGSVAVIASTILIKYTGWSGWDPIASCVIAVLIIAASYPLVISSARQLLLTVPSEVEYAVRSTLQELSGLRGVAAYAVPRFWLQDSGGGDHEDHKHGHHEHNHGKPETHDAKNHQKITGVIHVIATRDADLDEVRSRVGGFFQDRNIEALVHMEREEESHCWCGGATFKGKGGHARNRSTIAM